MPEVSETNALDLSALYAPHRGQQHLHETDAKVKVLEVGRRWGKSRFALWELLRRYVEALNIPVEESVVPPFHAWIVCPSFPQARQVWNELLSFTPQQFIAPGGVRQDERLVFMKGSEVRPWGQIEVKSAHDPESLQTAGLDFLWVTEAQDVSDKAFEKLLPTLRSPGRLSYAIFEGIPPLWADHWFHRAFIAGQQGRNNYYSFKAASFDNPLITDEHRAEIEMDREILPDRTWRRMYLAEFLEDAGYFRNISACIAGDLLPEPLDGMRYVAGLDLGRKLDATVLIVMDAVDRKVVHHYAWDDGTNWVLQREGITNQMRRWNIERLVIDATGMGGDIFTQELQEAMLPVEPFIITSASREALLQQLAVSMERENVTFPNVPALLRQLRAFQYRRLPSGNYRVEAPPGEHDDEVFALALALTACTEPAPVTQQRFRSRSRRYVPTQDEAAVGVGSSFGQQLMRDRRIERLRERVEAAGVR